MLNIKYTMEEMELVNRIKFLYAPSQIYEYTKDRMSDMLEYGLYTNEEFREEIRTEFDNPLDILNYDNDNVNGGSLYIYTEATKNGYIRGFDTIEEMVDFCIMWLYANDDLDCDFSKFINDGESFDMGNLINDFFSIIYK